MEKFIWVFIVGGLICVVGQLFNLHINGINSIIPITGIFEGILSTYS
jgi:hypothetical protein